jgi:hypothetical protein
MERANLELAFAEEKRGRDQLHLEEEATTFCTRWAPDPSRAS